MIKAAAGLRNRVPSTNVWFDIRNDVLWTLSESDHLFETLEDIKRRWDADVNLMA